MAPASMEEKSDMGNACFGINKEYQLSAVFCRQQNLSGTDVQQMKMRTNLII